MIDLFMLWLPILLSAAIVFILSSIIHMLSPWHKSDYPKMPDEDKVMDVLRPFGIPPGDYVVPRPSGREDMRSPEFKERMNKGPVVMLTVFPNGPSAMGMSLVLWFLYLLVIGFFVAYIAGRTLPLGTDFLHVFRPLLCACLEATFQQYLKTAGHFDHPPRPTHRLVAC